MIVHYAEQIDDLSLQGPEERIDRLNTIFKELFEQNEIVLDVMIDGQSYRDNYESQLINGITTIRNVQIHTVHGTVFVQDMIVEVCDYLPRLNSAIDSISDLFYGTMTQEDWAAFSQLLEGIGWIEQASNIILEQSSRVSGYESVVETLVMLADRLPGILSELQSAIESQEWVVSGDLIKYELGDIFSKVEVALRTKVSV